MDKEVGLQGYCGGLGKDVNAFNDLSLAIVEHKVSSANDQRWQEGPFSLSYSMVCFAQDRFPRA